VARIPLPTSASHPEAFALIAAKRSHAPNSEIFHAIATCPDILKAFIPMADAVREGCGLNPQLREMAIVMSCRPVRADEPGRYHAAGDAGAEHA
jgi:hypothetical protein